MFSTGGLTWDRLAELEPRLEKLMDRAKAVEAVGERFCANNAWFGYKNPRDPSVSIKRALCDVIGWERQRHNGDAEVEKLLRGHQAYNVAYDALYAALPDCKGDCSCA